MTLTITLLLAADYILVTFCLIKYNSRIRDRLFLAFTAAVSLAAALGGSGRAGKVVLVWAAFNAVWLTLNLLRRGGFRRSTAAFCAQLMFLVWWLACLLRR
jgi:hypothetical protein